VAEQGRRVGEARARELHAVAGVARKPDGDRFDLLDGAVVTVGVAVTADARLGRGGRACFGTHGIQNLDEGEGEGMGVWPRAGVQLSYTRRAEWAAVWG